MHLNANPCLELLLECKPRRRAFYSIVLRGRMGRRGAALTDVYLNASAMARKKNKLDKAANLSKDLWISPRFSLKGENGERAWDHRQAGYPGSARFLELADIALGVKKPEARKKKNSSASAHVTDKTEPYSR